MATISQPTPQPSAGESILSIRDLHVWLRGRDDREAHVVRGASIDVAASSVHGLVGESGSGKSITALSVLRLLPIGVGVRFAGQIVFDGVDLLELPPAKLRAYRGGDIAMVFQDPMTSLNPSMTIGRQLAEVLAKHRSVTRRAARSAALEALDRVGIPDPTRRLAGYPYELSGGMQQRVVLAMALMTSPRLLIADEPTTALDVTVQQQIIELLRSLQRDEGMSVLLITHDLGVVAELCDDISVMYSGQIVESDRARNLFDHPRHPYTELLLSSLPQVIRARNTIPDVVGRALPSAVEQSGCRFAARCPHREPACETWEPSSDSSTIDLLPLCRRADELSLRGTSDLVTSGGLR